MLAGVTVNAAPAAITVSATAGAVINGVATVTATATGGTAPFEYSINAGATFQGTGVFAGISVGATVTVTVRDANGCTVSSAPVTIGSVAIPGALTATVSLSGQILCAGGTASLTVTASGGTAPYTFSLNGGTFVSNNVFSGLTAGAFVVTVKDAGGATFVAASVTVNAAPAAITATATLNGRYYAVEVQLP